MNIWLCPVKAWGWRIIKRENLFGAPKKVQKIMREVRIGDYLVFHVFRPVNGIVGVYEVTSALYEENSDIWGKDEYTLRVKITPIQNLIVGEKKSIPLSSIFGNVTINKEFSVEPFLKNIWIAKLSPWQFERTKALLKQD